MALCFSTLGVKSFPLEDVLSVEWQWQEVLRHDGTQVLELHEGRGSMQHVAGADQGVHGLKVDEDGAEGEDRQQAPQGMVGRQGLAYRCGQDVRGPEVGHVEVICKGDDGDQRTPREV